MRPIRLELKGFSTFRDQTVVDFTDVDLVAFVGPTGAGKSTIIDGIIFALYGSVVRYKASNLVAPVINQLSTEARVRLDFAIGSTEYTAVRVIRRTAKGATTKEARLESDGDILAGNARELDDEVEALLGLTFDQFTKTVVLPQGEFARFLTETPEARQSLLRRLLGMELYRSMGATARERARTAETKRAALVEQRDDRDIVTTEVVAEAAAAFASLSALQSVLRDEAEALSAAELDETAAHTHLSETEAQLALLRGLKVPAAAGRLEKAVAKLEERRERAADIAAAAAELLADATDAVDALPTIAELERLVELHADAADIDARVSTAQDEAAATAEVSAQAVEADQAAAQALADLEAERTTAKIRAGAAGLRSTLEPGHPCPVCNQQVDEVPDHDVQGELAAIDARVEDLRRVAAEMQDTRRAAESSHAEAGAAITALATLREDLTTALDGEPNLKETSGLLRSARTAEGKLDKARTKAERALSDLKKVDAEEDELTSQSASLRRDLTAARDALASLGPPAPNEESISADWRALSDWGTSVTTDVQARAKQAKADAKTAATRAANHRTVIAELCTPYIDDDEMPDDPVGWLSAEIGRSQAHVESLEREQDAQAKTNARIDALHSDATVAGELGRLLNARGFEQWLMTDVMHTLAERATDRLIELSGGAYSLLTDGTEFSIRDHRNADEVRGARTLSGGETFLASLSLALALTDNIASLASDGAPAIESMFLDEGFGTLDTETLDVVASAIEELGAEGRMIGVVTHIRDLADRIPVRFEVGRTPHGSTVARTTID